MEGEPIQGRQSWREWWDSLEGVIIRYLLFVFVVSVVLYSMLPKIGNGHGDRSRQIAALTQINSFGTALDMFRKDNGRYPTTAEGLEALVKAPPGLKYWQQYLDSIPLDPWQHPYWYVCPGSNMTIGFELSCLGPDGRAGTDDDIKI